MAEDSKTYVFGQDSSILPMVMSMLQSKGVDPAVVTALTRNNGFLNGDNNILALIILFAIFGGGFGNWGGWNNGNTNAATDVIMQTLNRNGLDINSLANNLNLHASNVSNGITALAGQLTSLSGTMGLSAQQIINAIQSGDAGIASQLASCCCDIKNLVTTQGYESRINNMQQSQLIQNGFSQVGYTLADQTCAIKQNTTDNTNRVIAKLDAIEDDRKNREISNLTAQLTAANSRAERAAELAPIYKQLNDIACKQPSTTTIPYSPVVGVPSCLAWNAGLNQFGLNLPGNSIWS